MEREIKSTPVGLRTSFKHLIILTAPPRRHTRRTINQSAGSGSGLLQPSWDTRIEDTQSPSQNPNRQTLALDTRSGLATMPAMLEDPTAPPIYRTSGPPPYPTPNDSCIPDSITPRLVTLRDRITTASLLPISTPADVPLTLLSYLCAQFNMEIEKGDTYPMTVPLSLDAFGAYWFQSFGAIMLLGEVREKEEVWEMEQRGEDWERLCLGTFYIKPNYPGRSSHVCNGGFIVTDAARNRGVGRLMGEGYLEWAPKLNYTYSVFNLVYETNVASIRIWDALGFKRIGRVKACGNLRSSPNELVDAIIYGRDLGPEGEDFVSEERFDKIRFYLKHGKYPNGADRAEKSRLRSAATHYKLLPAEENDPTGVDRDNERLMLKDKEVVSDPQRQYEIARQVHAAQHGGINKTTATIAEKHHWVRIKETVSLVIKNCPDCKDASKVPTVRPVGENTLSSASLSSAPASNGRRSANGQTADPNSMIERLVNFDDLDAPSDNSASSGRARKAVPLAERHTPPESAPNRVPVAQMHPLQHYADIPLDPQIMQSHSSPHTAMLTTQQQRILPAHPVPSPPAPFPTAGTDFRSPHDAHFDLDLDPAHHHPSHTPAHHLRADLRLPTQRHARPDDSLAFMDEAFDDGRRFAADVQRDAQR